MVPYNHCPTKWLLYDHLRINLGSVPFVQFVTLGSFKDPYVQQTVTFGSFKDPYFQQTVTLGSFKDP